MTRTATLAHWLAHATQRLAALPANPRREAEALAVAGLGLGRATLALDGERELDAGEVQRLEAWLARRASGEPLAYLSGRRGFWTLDLEVGPDVLVPRPETELLVETALALAGASANDRLRAVDLGTGSGAIALALARERPAWQIVATDVAPGALRVARANARALGLAQVEFLHGDWCSPIAGRRFDLVISNPPYIGADEPEMRGDGLRFEPRIALTPGSDALQALRRIVAGAPEVLAAGGWLLLEHGATQGEAVRALLVSRGFAHVRSLADLAAHPRVTIGRWLNEP
jgi:release factor glutamine methyltransferase